MASCASGLNPYFIGLPILIKDQEKEPSILEGLNPYFIGLPILIRVLSSF